MTTQFRTERTERIRVLSVGGTERTESDLSSTFSVVSERTAEAALGRLDEGVDCVVTEYDLPGMDGVSLTERVRAEHPALAVVVHTATGSEHVASEAIAAGVTDYVPAGSADLGTRVREAVAEARRSASLRRSGRLFDALVDSFPAVTLVFDEDGYFRELLAWPGAEAPASTDMDAIVGSHLSDVFPSETARRFQGTIDRSLATGELQTMEYPLEMRPGTRWFEARVAPLGETEDGRGLVVWLARNVTDRREREQEIGRQRDELRTLNRINGVIREVIEALVGAPTRADIERIVCDHLASSSLYEFAWTGGFDRSGGGVAVRTKRGEDGGVLELLADLDDRGALERPASAALRTGEPQVARDVIEPDEVPEALRRRADDSSLASGMVLPLAADTTLYGVLGVASARGDAFSEREQTGFEVLAETIAFAIKAVKQRRLLLSDTVVQLEFRLSEPNSFFATASAELTCAITLDGIVPGPDGALLYYQTVEGTTPEALREFAGDWDAIEWARLIDEAGDAFRMEFAVAGAAPTLAFSEHGAKTRFARSAHGTAELVVEAPSDADVRAVVDAVQHEFPDLELVSKTEVDRPFRTIREFRRSVEDRLTDRQRTALRTASLAGYFDYPRASTAQEVAESMDISSPTLHQHLQVAQRKLLSAFFDDGTDGQGR